LGAVGFSIDITLVKYLQAALPLSVFVETGTFEGEAIARVREFFGTIHSIELSDYHHARAVDRFASYSDISLHHGDSAHILASLRRTLEHKAVLYWLDAHWCVADEVAGEQSQCPLLDELAALGRLNRNSVVLIDDARLFLATPPHPHEVSHWPRFQEVLRRLQELSSCHEVTVVNDVIVFVPDTASSAVSEYSRFHGIDWLTELHIRRILEEERDALAEVAAERLREIESLTRTAEERASLIESLTRTAEERVNVIEQLSKALEERKRWTR
jgi:hypothetical protein